MDSFFKKIVGKIDQEISDKFNPKFNVGGFAGSHIQPLSPRDVFRFRKQRGVNLGIISGSFNLPLSERLALRVLVRTGALDLRVNISWLRLRTE